MLRSTLQSDAAGTASAPAYDPIPRPALVLAVVGLVPFIAGAIATLFPEGAFNLIVRLALAPFGVVVLSFMGGVHWGLAMHRANHQALLPPVAQYIAGFSAPLYAWGALLLVPGRLVGALIVGFAVLLLFDLLAARRQATPSWFPRLRVPITIIIIVCLAISITP